MNVFAIVLAIPIFVISFAGESEASEKIGAWKIVSVSFGEAITPIGLADASKLYVGKFQRFYENGASGPFFQCQRHFRQTEKFLLNDKGSDNPALRSWLSLGIRIDSQGANEVTAECELPGMSSYQKVAFLELKGGGRAYFVLDGMVYGAVKAK